MTTASGIFKQLSPSPVSSQVCVSRVVNRPSSSPTSATAKRHRMTMALRLGGGRVRCVPDPNTGQPSALNAAHHRRVPRTRKGMGRELARHGFRHRHPWPRQCAHRQREAALLRWIWPARPLTGVPVLRWLGREGMQTGQTSAGQLFRAMRGRSPHLDAPRAAAIQHCARPLGSGHDMCNAWHCVFNPRHKCKQTSDRSIQPWHSVIRRAITPSRAKTRQQIRCSGANVHIEQGAIGIAIVS